MKHFIVRQIMIKLTALALGTLCFLQTQVYAQEMNGYVVVFPSVGLAPGQTLRLTLFNPAGEPLRVQPQIHHTGGMLVGMGDGSVRFVQPGVSQSFDFNRSEIPLTGEQGTGRIQLRASFLIGIAAPETIDRLVVSMETVSITDGTSNTVFFSEVLPLIGDDGREAATQALFAMGVLAGFVPGQTLRVTLFNPPSFESETPQTRANGHIKIFDRGGNLVAQSDEAAIPSGAFHSFDFNPEALGSPGERGTNRQQVRIKPFFNFESERLSRGVASFEIVDNRTGKTVVLSGQQCLVFFLGGIPDHSSIQPARSDVKTAHCPSGENRGCMSRPVRFARCGSSRSGDFLVIASLPDGAACDVAERYTTIERQIRWLFDFPDLTLCGFVKAKDEVSFECKLLVTGGTTPIAQNS